MSFLLKVDNKAIDKMKVYITNTLSTAFLSIVNYLNETFICKTKVFIACYDDVIKQLHI